MFKNASQEIYEKNKHADFTVKFSRLIDLGNSPNWELDVCEVSCSEAPLEALNAVDVAPCADHAIIFCNLILPQILGDSTVRRMRAFPTASCFHHEFPVVQYVPVEQR